MGLVIYICFAILISDSEIDFARIIIGSGKNVELNAELKLIIPIIPTALIIGGVWKIAHRKRKSNPKTYLELYKKKIITPIIRNFFPVSTYSPLKGLSQKEYKDMEYNEDYNTYKSEDLIEAEITAKNKKKVFLIFSDVYVSKRTEKWLKVYFHGMLGKIKLDKEFPAYIKITTKNNIDKKEQVLMDSTEFEKIFDVESSNKIISMQIITSDIMLNIIDIWNKTNVEFEIIIKDNSIKLRFFTGDMFEGSMDELNFQRKKSLKKYYDILEFAKNISIQIYDAICEADI